MVPEPDAAESCGFFGQKLQTYQCKLSDDLTFSSGRKVTRRRCGVLHRAHDADQKGRRPVGAVPQPEERGVREGRTITFNLSSRDATFPQKLATGAGSIGTATSTRRTSSTPGTRSTARGLVKWNSYVPGAEAELVPNPKYKGALKKTGVAVEVRYYKQLEISWRPGSPDRSVTHRQLPPATLAELNPGDPDKHITEADSAEIRNLVFNVRPGAPLANKKVRQAIASIIDRGRW